MRTFSADKMLEEFARDVARLEVCLDDLQAASHLSIRHTEAAVAAADIVRAAGRHLRALLNSLPPRRS